MEKIDFVVLWVDGNDTEWQKEKSKYSNQPQDNAANRFRDWDLMKYWFRGVEKFAPWVNKVYFVTYGHLPEFLNVDCPKLKIVRHDEYIPKEYLPTFSSHTIELNLHRIEGLSEQFVYFNDDMFLCKPIKPETFFKKGLPCEEGVEGGSSNPGDGNIYYHVLLNDVDLINRHFKKRDVLKMNFFKWFNVRYGIDNLRTLCFAPWRNFGGFKNSHLPVAFLKSTFETVWSKEYQRLDETCKNRFRKIEDVNQYIIRYWQLVSGKFLPRGVIGKRFDIGSGSIDEIVKSVRKQRYMAICLNDPEGLERYEVYQKAISKAFDEILPEKSMFEK